MGASKRDHRPTGVELKLASTAIQRQPSPIFKGAGPVCTHAVSKGGGKPTKHDPPPGFILYFQEQTVALNIMQEPHKDVLGPATSGNGGDWIRKTKDKGGGSE